jgi:hypothetical protein
VLSVGLLGASGCARPLEASECKQLLDHYTELLAREEDPTTTPERVAQAIDEARKLAERDPRFEFGACPKKIARKSYDCAMSAPTVDTVERCLIF